MAKHTQKTGIKKNRPVNQRLIAERAKVTQTVVSRVLSGKAREIKIAESTIERVLRVANELGYRPNPGVSIMQGRSTGLLGVIVRSFQDPFLGVILEEVNEEALDAGQTLLIKGFRHSRYDHGQMDSLLSYSPDALIVVGTMNFGEWDPSIFEIGKPIVQIGERVDVPNVIACGMDEREAARIIAEHLRDLGHANCAIIGDTSIPSRRRHERLVEALGKLKIKSNSEWHFFNDRDFFTAGQQAAERVLGSRDSGQFPFSAVVATGDMIAMGFLNTMAASNIHIPHAFSLCSYNNLDISALCSPRLTTIHQPTRLMARTAVQICLGQLALETVRLKPELRVRESTARFR